MLIAIVVLGVYPQLMFKVMDPAVTQLVEQLGIQLSPSPMPRARYCWPHGAGRLRAAPTIDYHALAPEIVLVVGICVVLLVDLFVAETQQVDHVDARPGSCCSARFVPVVTLA